MSRDLKKIAGSILFLILSSGCDRDKDGPLTDFNVITGTASKGIVSGATVSLIDSNGEALEVTAITGSDGGYSLTLSPELVAAGVSAPLQILVTSDGTATALCDADLSANETNDCFNGFDANGVPEFVGFGEPISLGSDFTMRAVLAELPAATAEGATALVNPTPLTEIATSLALGTGTTLTQTQVDDANSQLLAIISAVTGADVTGAELNEIPVVNVVSTDALSAASELSLAAASLSAGVLALVEPENSELDSVGKALTSIGADINAEVQATGNSNAVPVDTLAALSEGATTVVDRLFARNQALSALNGLRTQTEATADRLSQVEDDASALITPGSSEIDLGDSEPTESGVTSPGTVNADLVGEFTLVYSDLSEDNDRDPFDDAQQVAVVIGDDNSLTIDGVTLQNPFVRDLGDGPSTTEISWLDEANNIEYALSSNEGTFNEINVGDAANPQGTFNFPEFLGQLTLPQEDSGGSAPVGGTCGDNNDGAITGLALIANCAGTYAVDGIVAGNHLRGTIVIAADGAVDFDNDISFPASPEPAVFDRLFIEDAARIQANYGADDDGPVIQLFFDNDGILVQISFRNRSENIENVVDVTLQT